jgi:hypothetical protein
MARTFRSKRDTRPPTPFDITYDVPVTEKVEDSEADGGTVERETGEYEEKTATFHYKHKIPGDLMLRVQAGNDITNMVASGEQATAIRELLALVIVEQDEWQELMRSPLVVVDAELLGDLVNAIIEDASDRDSARPRS